MIALNLAGILALKHSTKVGRIKVFWEILTYTRTRTIQSNNVFVSYMFPELHRLYTVLSIRDAIRFYAKSWPFQHVNRHQGSDYKFYLFRYLACY